MEIKKMKEAFFDWLDDCPVQWSLNRDDPETIECIFYKEEED